MKRNHSTSTWVDELSWKNTYLNVRAGTRDALYWVRRQIPGGGRCDTRRSIIIVGPDRNADVCIDQRRHLKPLLMHVRQAHINVIEIYGEDAPRRNGTIMGWVDNSALRRRLDMQSGFHVMCLDDQSDVLLHGRRTVSTPVIAELVAGELPIGLPAPSTAHHTANHSTDHSAPAGRSPETSWSVGVLR